MPDFINKKKPRVETVTIAEEQAGQRVDNFLLARLKGVPKSRIYRLLRKGEVRVNKGRVKPEYRLQAGDLLRIPPVDVAERAAPAALPAQLLDRLGRAVLYEDSDWLVVDKPAGLAVHGGSGLSYGLIEAMRQLRPAERSLELCHRLDKATSGCIVLAKKRSALKRFHASLREKRLEKIYCALVAGRWPRAIDAVNVPLQKNVLQSGERMVFASRDGKPSQTHFKILQKFENYTLVEAKPVTGRTHQIRVHCREAGHPIIGDEKYGLQEQNRAFRDAGFGQLFLHARSITLPQESGMLTIESELPDGWQRCIDSFLSGAA